MRSRVRRGLRRLKSGLAALGRLILALPLGLIRLLVRLPPLLWRALVGMLRFLIRLPVRLWRGLKALVRFIVSLPGRVWRGIKRVGRFIASIPHRLRQGWQSLAFGFYRFRLLLREWQGRFASWWRRRVLPPRTLTPRAQVWSVLILGLGLLALLLLGTYVSHLLSQSGAVVVVTATPGAEVAAAPAPTAASLPLTPRAVGVSSRAGLAGASGDGHEVVAFSMRRNGNTDIYMRQLDDEQLLQLTYHPAEERDPAWAPDGQTLAFASHRGDNWDIYRLDLVSGALLRLTRHPHYDAHPSWSNDGAFVTFESYRDGNLDIYVMSTDGSQLFQLTSDPAADFAPAWSPDGRHVAFVSYRDGSKDIFLYPLDAGTESAVINLTQTPDRDEDAPNWSPDGSRLAFSVGRFGSETIYITTFDWEGKTLDEAQTQLFNPGSRPDWSPDGERLVYEHQRAGENFLIVSSVTGWGGGQEMFNSEIQLHEPDWMVLAVDPQVFAEQRQSILPASPSLYIEEILPTPESGAPYTIVALDDVNGGDDREFLSDRVDDSFDALRERVLQETGIDYLASIGDSFRAIGVEPPPGQSPRSWHKAARAFDLNQGLYEREDQLVELVREDIGFRTYWRVYLRVAHHDGSLGEPLSQAPWDLKARRTGGLSARAGGELAQEVPLGYYVDFTRLAADYGWERVPANSGWRQDWPDVNWWQFQKRQRLSWLEAMLELYRLDQVEAVFGPSITRETSSRDVTEN